MIRKPAALFTGLLVLVLVQSTVAQTKKQGHRSHPIIGQAPPCNENGSTAEMTTCAADAANAADAKRIKAFHDLLASVSDEPSLVAKLRTMERNWIAYRNSYLNAAYPFPSQHGDPGSWLWMRKYEAEQGMNEDHTKELEALKESLTIP
jgi:uncharacterized protein YecT (DUF1311 family)